MVCSVFYDKMYLFLHGNAKVTEPASKQNGGIARSCLTLEDYEGACGFFSLPPYRFRQKKQLFWVSLKVIFECNALEQTLQLGSYWTMGGASWGGLVDVGCNFKIALISKRTLPRSLNA